MLKASVLSNLNSKVAPRRPSSLDPSLPDNRTARLATSDLSREKIIRLLEFRQARHRNLLVLPFAIAFFAVCVATVLVHSDPSTLYEMEAALVDMYVTEGVQTVNDDSPMKFRNIQTHADVFDWLEGQLLPTLLVQTDYNGDTLAVDDWGYVMSRNRIIGAARVAVANTERQDCELSEHDAFYPDCFPSSGTDDNQYASDSTPSSDDDGGDDGARTAGTARSGSAAGSAGGSSATGPVEVVDDFFVDALAPDVEAYAVLASRKADDWLTKATQSMTVEFGVYNGELGVLGVVTLSLAFKRGGMIEHDYRVASMSMGPYSDASVYAYDVCFLIGVAAIFAGLVWQVVDVFKRRASVASLANWWNAVDATLVIIALVIVSEWVDIADRTATIDLSDYAGGDISFATDTTGMADLEAMILSLVSMSEDSYNLRLLAMMLILLAAFRILRHFRYQARLSLLTDTLRVAVHDLAHFAVLFALVLVAFIASGHALFGTQMREFSTVMRTASTLFNYILGEFLWEEMNRISVTGSYVYFWCFTTTVYLILMNLVLAILMDAFTVVNRKLPESQSIASELCEFAGRLSCGKRPAAEQGQTPPVGRKFKRSYGLFSSTSDLLKAMTTGPLAEEEHVTAESIGEALGVTRNEAAVLLRRHSLHHILPHQEEEAQEDSDSDDDDEEVSLKDVMKALKKLTKHVAEVDAGVAAQRRDSANLPAPDASAGPGGQLPPIVRPVPDPGRGGVVGASAEIPITA